jgi:hypothetical protein
MSNSAPAAETAHAPASAARLAGFGFASGFLAVLVFHQGMLALLHAQGVTPRGAWAMDPTKPFGVPLVMSAAFWGGLWGIVFALVVPRMAAGGVGYWLAGLLFGVIGPTLVAWFVVSPLKGMPAAGGWKPAGIATGLLVNGAWGIGTALFLWIFALRERTVAERSV